MNTTSLDGARDPWGKPAIGRKWAGRLTRRAGQAAAGPGHAAFGAGLDRLEERRVLAADINLLSITTINTVVTPGVEFEADFVVQNVGDTASGPFRVEYRLSRNTIFGDGDDVILGFRQVNSPITPGGQALLEEEFDCPRNVFTGNYHLGALADSLGNITEVNENNNLRFTTLAQIIVANSAGQADIDLEAAGVGATTGTYNAGQKFPGVATYRNNGAAASGGFTTIWFLSTNTVYGDADDIQLAVATSGGGLGAGQSFNDVFQLTIPISTPGGTYFFGVFVDGRFDINEPLEEDNNIDFSATPAVTVVGAPNIPDLQAVEVTTAGGSFEAGENISFTATIRNNGNIATGAYEVTYVLSSNANLGDSDDIVLISKAPMLSLAAGASTPDNRTIAIPSNATAGNYYIGVIVDPDDDVDEGSAENNNEDLTPTPNTTVEPPPLPEPDIEVLGGGSLSTEIIHNSKAQRSNGTGFGPVELDPESKQIIYKIRNTGIEPLIITLIEPRGQVPGDYEVVVLPELTIAPGESSDFEVRFSPSAFGTRRANIAIFTNDPDRPRFTMKIAGRGMPPDSAPDIDVRGNGNSISDNDRKARENTDTRYGQVAIGQTETRVYTIRNEGGSTLTLSAPFVRVTGFDSNQFEIVLQPALTVLEPGQSTTFTIAFAPSTVGSKRADIEVLTNDPDEATFNFRIIGTAITA